MKKQHRWGMTIALVISAVAAIAAAFAADFEQKKLNPPDLHKHPVYSQVATVSGEKSFVFVAGQVDRGLEYEMRSDSCRHSDWRGQYIGTMENVGRALAAGGASWDDVVFIRKFVTDMGAYLAMTGSEDSHLPQYFKEWEAPPSTLIQVVALSEPCQLLEIDVLAVIPAA